MPRCYLLPCYISLVVTYYCVIFDKGETAKLAHAMFKNAKLYWSTLKQYANVKQCPVSLTVLSGILVV